MRLAVITRGFHGAFRAISVQIAGRKPVFTGCAAVVVLALAAGLVVEGNVVA